MLEPIWDFLKLNFGALVMALSVGSLILAVFAGSALVWYAFRRLAPSATKKPGVASAESALWEAYRKQEACLRKARDVRKEEIVDLHTSTEEMIRIIHLMLPDEELNLKAIMYFHERGGQPHVQYLEQFVENPRLGSNRSKLMARQAADEIRRRVQVL